MIDRQEKTWGRHCVALSLALAAQGCVPIPVYKTIQKQRSFHIVDEANAPIRGAQILYLTSSDPYEMSRGEEAQITGEFGDAAFENKRELQTDMPLVMHGVLIISGTGAFQRQDFRLIGRPENTAIRRSK